MYNEKIKILKFRGKVISKITKIHRATRLLQFLELYNGIPLVSKN